jgi:hypothetical protein
MHIIEAAYWIARFELIRQGFKLNWLKVKVKFYTLNVLK